MGGYPFGHNQVQERAGKFFVMDLEQPSYPKVWESGCLSIQHMGTASVGKRQVEEVQNLKEAVGGQVLHSKNADILG